MKKERGAPKDLRGGKGGQKWGEYKTHIWNGQKLNYVLVSKYVMSAYDDEEEEEK